MNRTDDSNDFSEGGALQRTRGFLDFWQLRHANKESTRKASSK
jgi:hypothetical protein